VSCINQADSTGVGIDPMMNQAHEPQGGRRVSQGKISRAPQAIGAAGAASHPSPCETSRAGADPSAKLGWAWG